MYISKEKKNIRNQEEEKVADAKKEKREELEEVIESSERKKEEREIVNPNSVIFRWKAPEHEVIEKDQRWYLISGLVLAGIVTYAIFTDGLIMAITFILIGMVGYIVLNRTPRIINFYITDDGLIADKEIYEFEEIDSFWIFHEDDGMQSVSLHLKKKIAPFVHIPLGDEDPVKIREILMEYLREIKQKPSLVDKFERFLGI